MQWGYLFPAMAIHGDVGRGMDIGSLIQQGFHIGARTLVGRPVEGGEAVVVLGFDVRS